MPQLTFETLLQEIQTKIKNLESNFENDIYNQRRAELSQQFQRGGNWRTLDGIVGQIKQISENERNDKFTLTQLKKDEDILIRDIDERNRQQAEFIDQFTNTISTQLSNDITNTKNEVIAQSMQNEDLRNKLIIGGAALGGLALFSGIILKKKRSRK